MPDTYICPDCQRRCYTGTPHMCGPDSLAHADREQGYVIATAIKPESKEPCAWVYRPHEWRNGKPAVFETTSVALARAWIAEQRTADDLVSQAQARRAAREATRDPVTKRLP